MIFGAKRKAKRAQLDAEEARADARLKAASVGLDEAMRKLDAVRREVREAAPSGLDLEPITGMHELPIGAH